MRKKLSQHGNSKAVIIDKPLLDLLDISDKTELEITTDGTSLIITPVTKKGVKRRTKKLDKIIEKNLKKYAPLLKKLSKS